MWHFRSILSKNVRINKWTWWCVCVCIDLLYIYNIKVCFYFRGLSSWKGSYSITLRSCTFWILFWVSSLAIIVDKFLELDLDMVLVKYFIIDTCIFLSNLSTNCTIACKPNFNLTRKEQRLCAYLLRNCTVEYKPDLNERSNTLTYVALAIWDGPIGDFRVYSCHIIKVVLVSLDPFGGP